MTISEELGRKAYCLDPENRRQIRDLWVKKVGADAQTVKDKCELRIRLMAQEEKLIQSEIASRGNISEQVVRESLWRGIWLALLLVLSSFGEFVFANWTIKYFGLGTVETILVAATIVIISLKAFDLYIKSLRQQYPELENQIFLIMGCIGVVAIFLLIFFAADIRQNLYQTTSLINVSSSAEDTIRHADKFYKHNSGSFIWLMVTLTMAFTVVGGVSYHTAKQRIFVSWPLLKLYRRLRNIRNEMQLVGEERTAQDSRVDQFLAEFETGSMKEHVEQMKGQIEQKPNNESHHTTTKKTPNLGPVLVFPVTLIIFALILFILFKGTARGAQHIIFLDISKSVSVKDYSGKETEFQKNIRAIECLIRKNTLPGDSLKVACITEATFSRPYILLDTVVSEKKGAFGEMLARERLLLLKEWGKLQLKPTAKATDIFGALNLSAILFNESGDKKNLIIFSDMRHCSDNINLEKGARVNSKSILEKVNDMGLVPDLKGVRVWCLGVHSAGKSPAYWASLKAFWAGFFKRANAELIMFSIERRFKNE